MCIRDSDWILYNYVRAPTLRRCSRVSKAKLQVEMFSVFDFEPSQMVFQGDARNELGPSPRGAIYRKREAWKHLFTRSSVQSYQDWNIAENENLQQLLAEMNSNDSQTKTARENMRRQWAGYGEPKWQRMRRQSAATAITNQTEATRSQQHQH